jgi:hypothetical protein
MHKATCGIHANMRLVSDTPLFLFLGLVRFKGYVCGLCSSLSFKAQMKVASTMEPPRSMIPAFLSSKFRRKAQALPSPSRFKAMAHLRKCRRIWHLRLHEVYVHRSAARSSNPG